ncbi:MAG: phosphate/phosphite/phosphonate ABC transporter substrate-binding protein [Rhodospirillales bacterium]|nr:phosphate/phosphite/phosphonate ABC transporter substrate-binding protein [Rhodospirillales bacterium]
MTSSITSNWARRINLGGIAVLLSALFTLTALGPAQAGEPRTFTLSRAPQLSAITTARTWQPFVDYLTQETGHKIVLKLYNRRLDFDHDVVAGIPDFYYGNPGYFVVGRKLHGYRPLIRSNARQLKGIVVVRADSPFKSVKDLDGQKIAFPAANALAASLYIRALLVEREKINFKPHYVGSHDNVYRNVANGTFPAGGGVHRTLNRETKGLKKSLRVLYETPGMSPHPLTAHPRVPADVAMAVQKAVLKLRDSEDGMKMLKKLKIEKPVIANFERDYLSMEELGLKMYAPLLVQMK